MALNKLTGVYFGETVKTIDDSENDDYKICFIIQTSTAIPTLDEKLVLTSMSDLTTACEGKGLTKTLQFIDTVTSLSGNNSFYVYSIKTDTTTGWTEAITNNRHMKEIRKIIYYEENLSSNSNTIQQKITSIGSACNTCFNDGAFRTAYIVPEATVEKAVSDAEDTAENVTVYTTMNSIVSTISNGRVCVLLPDIATQMMTTICTKQFYEEPGDGNIVGTVEGLKYNFTTDQMITLRNSGIILPRAIHEDGSDHYEIELSVTTSYAGDATDGVLVSRTIADELLYRVGRAIRPFIKKGDAESNIEFIQTAIDDVIATFVKNGYVKEEGTILTAFENGNMKAGVTGTITTSKPLAIIEVNSTLE